MQTARASLLPAILLLAAAVALTGDIEAPAATASTTQQVTVSMIGNRFVPADLTVAAGATIVWVNDDYDSGELHNIIAEDGSFASGDVPPGSAFSLTFRTPGTYPYYCDLHEGMVGTVVVQ